MKTIYMILFAIVASLNINAQTTQKTDSIQLSKSDTIYSCSSHPNIKSDKAGNCPNCSSKLIKKHQHLEKSKDGYSCSMHPDKKSTTPGKCPTCGMKLIESREPEQEKGGFMGGEN